MTERATLTRKRQYATIYHEVEIDVDITDLAENGWHSEEDCQGRAENWPDAARRMREAIRRLHRQAHGETNIVTCKLEPCCDLQLSDLTEPR